MYYTYVARSLSGSYLYKGHCKDLEERLKQHNSGQTKSLRPHIPVEIVYFEEFETLQEAVIREKYFKSAAGRRFLKTVL